MLRATITHRPQTITREITRMTAETRLAIKVKECNCRLSRRYKNGNAFGWNKFGVNVLLSRPLMCSDCLRMYSNPNIINLLDGIGPILSGAKFMFARGWFYSTECSGDVQRKTNTRTKNFTDVLQTKILETCSVDRKLTWLIASFFFFCFLYTTRYGNPTSFYFPLVYYSLHIIRRREKWYGSNISSLLSHLINIDDINKYIKYRWAYSK